MVCHLADSNSWCSFRYNGVKHRCGEFSFVCPMDHGLAQADCESRRVPRLSLSHDAISQHHEEIAQPSNVKHPAGEHHLRRVNLRLSVWRKLNRRMKVDKGF